jgi:hypothetical protein
MGSGRRRLPGEAGFLALLLGFALFVLYQAYLISGFASPSSPGLFPMLAGLVMVVAAATALLRSLALPPPEERGVAAVTRRVVPPSVVVYAAMIVAFMLALEPLGFVVSSFLFLLASFLYLHRKSVLLALLLSAGAVAAILVVFRYVFQVVLPEGFWP